MGSVRHSRHRGEKTIIFISPERLDCDGALGEVAFGLRSKVRVLHRKAGRWRWDRRGAGNLARRAEKGTLAP